MTDNFWEGFIKEAKIYRSLSHAMAGSLKPYELKSGQQFLNSIASKRNELYLKRLQAGRMKPEIKSVAQKASTSKPQTSVPHSFE